MYTNILVFVLPDQYNISEFYGTTEIIKNTVL